MRNGWFHSYWQKNVKIVPRKSGWYAAKPECCPTVVRAYLQPNLLDVCVEGNELHYDVYDFSDWYPLRSSNDPLPEFRG